MIPKPADVRVIARPRTREESLSPTGGQQPTQAKTQNLPQGRWVGRSLGKSRVHRTLDEGLDTISPTGLKWKDRLKIVLAWMVTHAITNRAALFAGCPESGNSAALHNAAIRKLKRAKMIERQWREYVFTCDDPAQVAKEKKLLDF